MIKKIVSCIFAMACLFSITHGIVKAATEVECQNTLNSCVRNCNSLNSISCERTCTNAYNNCLKTTPEYEALKVFGVVKPTPGVEKYGDLTSGGPIVFVNAVIAFITAVAGIWLLITIILTGIKVISSVNDPKAFGEAMKKIMWSIIGLVVVAMAYIIAGWVSKQLFGTEEFILNPEISKVIRIEGKNA